MRKIILRKSDKINELKIFALKKIFIFKILKTSSGTTFYYCNFSMKFCIQANSRLIIKNWINSVLFLFSIELTLFLFFFEHWLACQRMSINNFIMGTMNKSWLSMNASHNCIFVVIISWIWPIPVLFVIRWTTHSNHWFTSTSQLIRPITSFDSFIVHQSFWMTLFTFRNTPNAFRIKNIALVFTFWKETELPWASWTTDWLCCLKNNLFLENK